MQRRLKTQQMTREDCTDGSACPALAAAKASKHTHACFYCRESLLKPSWWDQKIWTDLFLLV